MIPLALRITNFKSFKKTQVFEFPRVAGLYFMLGINEAEPRLEANGSGKTTIWDALFWCLFDKTTRGLKAGDVCNWDAEKGMVVEFDFLLDSEECVWTITRTWKPNSWKLSHVAEFITDEEVVDLAKDPANPVLAAIRLEAEPFLQSILMAQGRPMFLDLKREPQAELFSNVLGCDRWIDYAGKASKKASAQDAISREIERKLSRLEGELANLGKQDFKQSAQEWEDAQNKKLGELTAEHEKLVAQRKGLKDRLEQAKEREEAARKALQRAQVDPRVEEYANALRQDVRESRDLLAGLKGQCEAHIPQLQTLLDKPGECPTCGQAWGSKEHLDDHIADLERLVKKLKKQVDEEEAVLLNLEGRLAEEEDALAEQEATEKAARQKLDDAQRDTSNARRALETMDRDLDRIEDRAGELAEERNPYKAIEEDARRRGRQLREELEDVRADLDASNSRHGLLSFWVRGFKELRLQEIAEALTELEIEVNSCVTALGLVDWELRFAVDKETKGGNIQRGFSVTVRNPQNPFATPWEAWSGGEGQRLRLAANMGLGDLIRSRTGAGLNLEVWDEPTNGLSPQGIRDLLESLETRARQENRIIFLVDHKAHDFGGFAGQYTIVKAPSGSRIRYSGV